MGMVRWRTMGEWLFGKTPASGARSWTGCSSIGLWPRRRSTMTESGPTRVAVYLDFDNIVISRYDQVHGRSSFQRDKAKGLEKERLELATVDIGAVIDFASSFGTLVLTRAYADWSADVNAGYHGQLVGRAVDLVQLFPAAAYGKNGADIRLARRGRTCSAPPCPCAIRWRRLVIALAQRCKRLGRYVIGIGVAGASSRSLAAACDEFVTYDALGYPPLSPRFRRVADAANG